MTRQEKALVSAGMLAAIFVSFLFTVGTCGADKKPVRSKMVCSDIGRMPNGKTAIAICREVTDKDNDL